MPRTPSPQTNQVREPGVYAGILSLTEVGLGSVLHGFQVPMAGHLLSLNQGALLALSVRRAHSSESRFHPATVSTIAALLKSWSPAGRRLTPMLAISAQGVLFNVGTLLFGQNVLGAWVGGVLLAVWGFVQPVLIYAILFGEAWVDAALYLLTQLERAWPGLAGWIESHFWVAVFSLVAMKIALFTLFLAWIYLSPGVKIDRWLTALERLGRKATQKGKQGARKPRGVLGLTHAFLHPLFLFSFGMTALFFVFAESTHATSIWILLRPLAAGLVLYFGALWIPVERLAKRRSKLARGLATSIAYLQNQPDPVSSEVEKRR